MTNEQWLVYLYGIYPNGTTSIFWFAGLIVSLIYLFIIWVGYSDANNKKETQFVKTGKWKFGIPIMFMFLLFLSNFVPNRTTFMYIVATPYIIESGKSLIDSLQDPTSKAYKINQLLDKGLDKALIELDKTISDPANPIATTQGSSK